MAFKNFELTINGNTFILIALLLFAILYSYYIYKYTIPPTTAFMKFILIFLRSSALILIIAILFEPLITLNYVKKVEPDNLLFVDNSSSIVHKDSLKRAEKVKQFITEYKKNVSGNVDIALFGKITRPMKPDEELLPDFTDPATNFDKLIPYIKKRKNKVASITIISDGIITEGSNSTTEFEKLGVPVFTVAIGDTTRPSDVGIKKVEFNKILYRKNPTKIKAVISNSGFAGKNIWASLVGKSGVIERKQIKLNAAGINNVLFNFTPQKTGKNYLSVEISRLTKEETYANNIYPFVVNVLNNKTNVLVIAGAPSPDLDLLCQTLQQNNHVNIHKILQIAPDKFEDNLQFAEKIDSAELFILVDFPSAHTPQNLSEAVMKRIGENLPYLLFITEQTDLHKLSKFNSSLPFGIKKYSYNYFSVQTRVVSEGNGIITDAEKWSNLPPIKTTYARIALKKGTTILAQANKNAGVPILFTQKVASSRRMVFNGFNFWRWKLNADDDLSGVFDSFIYNSIKWLTSQKEKRIFIKTTKDIYNPNERIEFIANLYDETLSPINDAIVEIEITSENYKEILKLSLKQNGFYTNGIDISKSGKFKYIATVTMPDNKTTKITGTFAISNIKVENINFVLNSNYLKLLTNITSGISFNVDDYSKLFTYIEQLTIIKKHGETVSTRLELWRNKWVLIIVVLLFSLEWIIRKRKGML